jgi:hypothetical protein
MKPFTNPLTRRLIYLAGLIIGWLAAGHQMIGGQTLTDMISGLVDIGLALAAGLAAAHTKPEPSDDPNVPAQPVDGEAS